MTRKLKLLVREREGEHGMTLEEQIGQVLMVGFSSTPPPLVFHFYDRNGPSLFFWQVYFLWLLAATIVDKI
jgi:hypothetical protein